MIGGRTVFVIPGFRHTPKNKAYKEIARILRKEGYSPVLVNIQWRETTISQNTEYFLKKYKKINTRKKYILGFSFGAMIAFLASTKVSVSGLILCSLSPYFNEDLSKAKRKQILSMPFEKYRDFKQLRCVKLAKQTKAKKILMLYGANEERALIKRVNETFNLISLRNKYLIKIQKTEHNIADKKYLNKISQIAKQLN